MSRIIAKAAIRGAHRMVERAEGALADAIKAKGRDAEVAYPNTAYFLPIMYLFLGQKVQKLGDLEESLAEAKKLPDFGAMQAAAERIAKDQRELRLRMSEILARMEKLQSRQDLANKLQTIIRWSQRTLTGIRRREQEEVRGIWNP